MARVAIACAVLALSVASIAAIDPERNFSGAWFLDSGQSLTIDQQDSAIRCTHAARGSAPVSWTYDLNGHETRYRIGGEDRNSLVKWEGAALLINTLVSGPRNYTEMDRWRLSPDRRILTITRQTVDSTGTKESTVVYHRDMPDTASASRTAAVAPAPPAPVAAAPLRREPPAPASDFLVRAGTRIPLSLRNTVDTRHSHEGDHIYLQTIAPVTVENRIVIPRGSYVNGTITSAKAAGALKGKGELYIRFDSLILPNGATRDFRSRLGSVDASAQGQVDPQEGKVTGRRENAGEGRAAAEGGTIGAGVGGIAGAAAGHPITGLGVGGVAGAAAGLAGAVIKHRPDVSLPSGTVVEMVLDRDLHFNSSELLF